MRAGPITRLAEQLDASRFRRPLNRWTPRLSTAIAAALGVGGVVALDEDAPPGGLDDNRDFPRPGPSRS